MEEFSEEGKIVGVVIDVSLRHDDKGKRILDSVKKSLIELVLNYLEDDVDQLYLFHPDLVESLSNHGDQLSAISNYETDGWDTDLVYATKKTLYVLANHGLHCKKYLFYITDKLKSNFHLEKLLHLNNKDLIDAHIILVGISNFYDQQLCQSLSDERFEYFHIDHPSELVSKVFKEPCNGERKNVCGTTHEQYQ